MLRCSSRRCAADGQEFALCGDCWPPGVQSRGAMPRFSALQGFDLTGNSGRIRCASNRRDIGSTKLEPPNVLGDRRGPLQNRRGPPGRTPPGWVGVAESGDPMRLPGGRRWSRLSQLSLEGEVNFSFFPLQKRSVPEGPVTFVTRVTTDLRRPTVVTLSRWSRPRVQSSVFANQHAVATATRSDSVAAVNQLLAARYSNVIYRPGSSPTSGIELESSPSSPSTRNSSSDPVGRTPSHRRCFISRTSIPAPICGAPENSSDFATSLRDHILAYQQALALHAGQQVVCGGGVGHDATAQEGNRVKH